MSNNKEILFCPLGGVGEIGANMSLYGYGEKNSIKTENLQIILESPADLLKILS